MTPGFCTAGGSWHEFCSLLNQVQSWASAAGNLAQECCMNLSMNLMGWVHEISQSALAAAVAILGLVILLELRSIARLRSLVDGHLTRVFEQLDLLRLGSQPLAEANERAAVPATRIASTTAPASAPAAAAAAYPQPPLGAGEARLLAALTAARARAQLDRPQGGANH
jgi:hypothetical protein